MPVKITLLGEVAAHVDQRPVGLGPRAAAGLLAVDAGRLVPADRLVEPVWDANRPRRTCDRVV